MKTLTAEAAYGYTGQYISRIKGRNSKMTFEREFLGRRSGKRNDVTSADIDTNGLYETCSVSKRGKVSSYCVILDCPTGFEGFAGTLRQVWVEKSEAMILAKRMDGGESLPDCIELYASEGEPGSRTVLYRLVDKREAAAKQVAATYESALAAAWAAIEAMPAKEQKRLLKDLRLKVEPKLEPVAATVVA